MKNALLFAICFSFSLPTALSQSFDSLDANNINAGFAPGTALFLGDTSVGRYSLYEVPKGGGVRSIFSSSLMLSGTDAGNALHVAGDPYGRAIHWGPVATSYGSAYDAKYFKVWKITRDEILDHRAHYNSPGYNTPDHIAQWPGNGNTANGEAAILAPFADMNNNGLYEPALGDYPDVCGDQAIFMMLNDDAPLPPVLACNPMHTEFHILAYSLGAAQTTDTALNNTVFFKIKVFNRSGTTYSDVRLSNFVDIDLGCFNNDRMGCDTVLNSFFGYNNPGSPDGPVCSPVTGYGSAKVAQGMTFLNQRMSAFEYSSSNGPTGIPSTCAQIRNAALGLWTDGTHITDSGNGYSDNTGFTSFVYPGDPTDSSQWSEIHTQSSYSIHEGDRRGVGTVSLGNMAPGQSFSINMAYVTSFADSTAPTLSEVTRLKRDIRSIRNSYTQGTACNERFATGIDDVTADQVSLMPNPTHDQLTLKVSDRLIGISYTLIDMTGRVIEQNMISTTLTTISMSTLSSGIYLLQVSDKTYKVIKE